MERNKAHGLCQERGGEVSLGSGLVSVSAFLFPKVRINGPFLYLGGVAGRLLIYSLLMGLIWFFENN